MAVDVLDGRGVSPGDFRDLDAEDGGDSAAFARAGGPAAQDDCGHPRFLKARLLDKLLEGNGVLPAEVGDADRHGDSPVELANYRHFTRRRIAMKTGRAEGAICRRKDGKNRLFS
jgi:hypothetical protein